MIANYRLKFQDRAELEKALTGLGAKVLSTEVLSIARQRFTRLVNASTYAEGIKQLQEAADLTENLDTLHCFQNKDGSQICRPLTFAEPMTTFVESFKTDSSRSMEERLALLNHFTASCTGITYKADSPRFKLQQISNSLITIAPNFNASFLPIVYDEAEGVEIDTSDATNGLYNQPLTEKQVLENRGWLIAIGDTEDGKETLTEFKDIVFTALSQRRKIQSGDLRAMGFYVQQKPTDQLRALVVCNLDSGSSALGSYVLNNNASFLLLAQKSAPKSALKK